MEILNVMFQILGGVVVLWMLGVALVALFNVLGNGLLYLAQRLGEIVERLSLGTIKVVNTVGVYDRPVVVASAGVRQPAEKPRTEPTAQAPQAKPAAPPAQPTQQAPQAKPAQHQPQQQQQAKPQDGDGMQKMWQRIQKLEGELSQVRSANHGGTDQRTAQALDAILKNLQQLDSNMRDMHDRLNELEANQVDMETKMQDMSQGRLY